MKHATNPSTARIGRDAPGARGRLVAAMAALVLAVATPGLSAQEVCDERAGTLGIQGLACEGCTFRMTRSGIEEARFRTEPRIIAVARGFTGGDRLRAGDRIVAIDGSLITTRAGSRKLVELQSGQRVALRVRRDGRAVDLELVAGSACDLRRAADAGEVDLERWSVVMPGAPAPPRAPAPAVTPLPELPAPPRPPMPPRLPPPGYLGFGLRCTDCGIRDGTFYFSAPPEITSVADDGPAAAAGLQAGDVMLEVDGLDITGTEGARRFSEIEPGQSVQLTVRRGQARRTATVAATERPPRLAPAPVSAPTPLSDQPLSDELRFEGRLGNTVVEVRGAPVRVERNEETGEIVIHTGGNVIRLTRTGG